MTLSRCGHWSSNAMDVFCLLYNPADSFRGASSVVTTMSKPTVYATRSREAFPRPMLDKVNIKQGQMRFEIFYFDNTTNQSIFQLEEQCDVSYWKEDAPVTREALVEGVKVMCT